MAAVWSSTVPRRLELMYITILIDRTHHRQIFERQTVVPVATRDFFHSQRPSIPGITKAGC